MPKVVKKSKKRSISSTSSISRNSQSSPIRKKKIMNNDDIKKRGNLDEYDDNPENWGVSSEVEVSDAPSSNEVAWNTQLIVEPRNFATEPVNFIELVSKDVFVDKTLLIQEIITGSDDHILITRPHRWGKTLAMDMLKTFFQPDVDDKGAFDFEINEKRHFFEDLNITNQTVSIKSYETEEIHQVNTVQYFQGHYPVIFITFSNIVAENQDILSGIKTSISKAYHDHAYLLQGLYNIVNDSTKNKADKVMARDSISHFEEMYFNNGQDVSEVTLTYSIYNLSKWLHKHYHQKVYILIDDYDAPLNSSTLDQEQYEMVLHTLLPMFQAALKNTDGHLEKGILTGLLSIPKISIFAGFNNFSEFTVLDKIYAQYFGFTEKEVTSLLEENVIQRNDEKERIDFQKKQVKNWYNGYSIGGYTLYNPWSIMHYLGNGAELGPYWINTGKDSLLQDQLLKNADDPFYSRMLQDLLVGKTIPVRISDMVSSQDFVSNTVVDYGAFWGLMLFSGYITTDKNQKHTYSGDRYLVKIPNMEVRKRFENIFINWTQQALTICEVEYNKLVNDLLNGNIDVFQRELNVYLNRSTRFRQTGDGSRHNAEVFYHGLIQGLLLGISNTHDIESESESGGGLSDTILIIPKTNSGYDIAILFGYKVSQSRNDLNNDATVGLHQITGNNYNTHLLNKTHLKAGIKMGMSFFQKRVLIKYTQVTDQVYSS